jgi:hypothetical protein
MPSTPGVARLIFAQSHRQHITVITSGNMLDRWLFRLHPLAAGGGYSNATLESTHLRVAPF